MNPQEPLYPNSTFHIYNHAVGRDNLFDKPDNYRYFLQKYAQHVAPVVDTFAYCLMPNHFHLAVRIKGENELLDFFQRRGGVFAKKTLSGFQTLRALQRADNLSKLVSKQFSNLFNSYAQAVNRDRGRSGNLFEQKFKRKPVTDDTHFRDLIQYIHQNPIHHGFTDTLSNWPHSSYHAILSDKPTQISRIEVLGYFSDRENFAYCHTRNLTDEVFTQLEEDCV